MGEDSYEMESSEGHFDTEASLQVTTHHQFGSDIKQERDSILPSRMISPNPLWSKTPHLEADSMQTEERPRRAPLIQPPPPYCPLLPPGWKALAARAPTSPYIVPFLLSPSGKRFYSVGEAVRHLVNPPKIEQQIMDVEMPVSEQRRTRKMLTKRYQRTSLRKKTLMQNTERRAVAELDATEPFWDPSDVTPPELNWDPNYVPQEPISESSEVPPEPYWDEISFEIVLEGLNPLLQCNVNNNNLQVK